MNYCKRVSRPAVFLPFIFLLWGCLEYEITTQVMPDGRLLRTVVVKGDSADIFSGSFHVPCDSTWDVSTRLEPRKDNDANKGSVYVYEARKEFSNFGDLNHEFYSDSSFKDHIAIQVNLRKKFQWYYTHYYYTETYGRLFPFRSVPVSEYLSDDEIQIHQADEKDIYYSHEKDCIMLLKDTLNKPVLSRNDSLRFKALRDTIEQKFESWQKINIYNDFYHVVTSALRNLGNNVDTAAARKSFYMWLDKERTFETGIENDDAFVNAASAYFKVDPVKLQAANPTGFDIFNKKFRVAAYSLETYTNSVLMPGLIIRSNAKKINVNEANWTFKIDNFYAEDYIMSVESRVVNRWFIISAGVLLILAIAIILLRLFRK
jgi:hypothetical protein